MISIPWDNRNEHCVSLVDTLGKLNFSVILKHDWITFVQLHERMAFQPTKTSGANCLLKVGTECISSESFSTPWSNLLGTCTFFSERKLCCAQAASPACTEARPLGGLRRLPLSCPNRPRHGTPSGLAGRLWVLEELPWFLGNWYASAAPGLTRSRTLVCPCTELPNLCLKRLSWLPSSWRPASNPFLSGTDEGLSKGPGPWHSCGFLRHPKCGTGPGISACEAGKLPSVSGGRVPHRLRKGVCTWNWIRILASHQFERK